MKIVQRSRFKYNPIAAKLVLAATSVFAASVAYGNAGYGVNTDISGTTIPVPTYYANSPQGLQPALDPLTHLPVAGINCATTPASCVDTGTALRKFVDPLPGVMTPTLTGNSGGIPLGITEKWKNPLTGVQTQDDYHEIAIVEYTQQMHSDLAKATTLRGYVQVETPGIVANGLKDAAGVSSEHIPLKYPDGTAILYKDPNSPLYNTQVYAVHKPSYMGPLLVASKGTAKRIKYYNFLPYTDSLGAAIGSPNGGEINIPVDTYLNGGGPGVDASGKPLKLPSNRADIHWHGGDTPWISDGTPQQWIAPAGEASTASIGNKGASAQNVPDMPDPGPGAGTFYFPNNLSARLMFYHDHTVGLTRLNVYDGLAAGYIVIDPVEQDLVAKGIIPNTLLGVGIPLVIQDKTFVPKNIGPSALANNGGVQSQDAKWDSAHWGQPGDLWFPHVYETNQDPNSIDGTNPVGRWDWGPWFWPVFPAQYSLPSGNYGDVTTTPEAFMDTPIVNGQAYPTMTVDPQAYRFRILSVPNDRSMNYNFFEAVDANGVVCDATANPIPAATTLAPGQTGALATCTEVRMVPAAATAGFPATWPSDGRVGGVPDPTTAGPDIIQIGNEAGFLPAPAIWHSQPVTYDQNVRSMTVFNVLNHGLLMGAAERADIIVDFSKFAGKTLILYNDAPAPMPGFDPRIDYFSGDGDQTIGGGAYNTLPGYGPNTRTVMQIKVNKVVTGTTAPAAPFNVAALQAALPVAYKAAQPGPNVPESAYNAALGTAYTDNYPRIFTGTNTQPEFSFTAPGYNIALGSGSAIVTTTGTNYTSMPTVSILGELPRIVQTIVPKTPDINGAYVNTVNNLPAAGATATAILSNGTSGTLVGINITSVGPGYLTKPTVVLSGGGAATQGTATLTSYPTAVLSTVHVINKSIQELFDPVYGRMNATLAVELPYSSSQIATTIPLSYIDAPIDYYDGIKDGETQIWKITHNGVDSHPVHFHLVNVQVLDRVDWAGVVKPPEANEVGWKEVLRMNPLEDVYVAVKAVHPVVPFGLPRSARMLDPAQAVGSQTGFTQIDQMTGNAPLYQTYLFNGAGKPSVNVPTTAYSNQLTDFDNEYVWHCHILGHEENDFMRPFIFHPNVVVPDEPGNVTVSGSTVTWVDPTPFGGQDSQGVPTAGINAAYPTPTSSMKNEIGFKIYRTVTTTTVVTNTVTKKATTTSTVVASPATPIVTMPANTTSWTDTANLLAPAAAVVTGPTVSGNLSTTVTVTTGATVVAYNAAGDSVNAATLSSAVDGTNATAATNTLTAGAAQLINTAASTSAVTGPAAPTGLSQTATAAGVVLTWNAVPGATGYLVTYGNPAAVATIGIVAPATVPATTFTIPATPASNLLGNASVVAVMANGTQVMTSAASSGLYNGVALAPVGFTANPGSVPGTIVLTWGNNPTNVNNVTGFTLSWAGGSTLATSSTFATPTAKGTTVTGLTSGGVYTFSLLANGSAGNSPAVTPTYPSLGTSVTAP